jgi:hypothetical protein
MMHEPEKSDSAIAATARAGHRTGKVCHRRWAACGKSQRYAAPLNVLVPYPLSLDTSGIKKSHQTICGMITARISRFAAAVAARPAFVRYTPECSRRFEVLVFNILS